MSLALPVTAQKKTFLNIDAGPQWSINKVADPGNQFTGSYVKSSIAGATLGQELAEDLTISAGAYYQSYKDGINMIDDRPQQARYTSYSTLLFPLRLEYRVQLSEYPVSLIPRIGYIYGRPSLPGPASHSGILTSPEGTTYAFQYQQSFEPVDLHMLETGIGLGLRIVGFWQTSVHLSYLTGFTDPVSNDLTYSGSDGRNYSAEYTTKGNTLYTSLSLQLPVSNIWQNKDYRVRSRIERSVGRGKSVDRSGQIYLGAEVAPLYRQFITSDPAVGARPMENRGLFRYANLHTGIYVGYMISDDLGIDLGAYYQRSSTFYSLMYDHGDNLTVKNAAPLFLEIPLRVRYFYNAYKNKLHYMVYGGASALTHFSGEAFDAGGAPFTYTSPTTGAPVSGNSTYTASRITRVVPVLRIGTGFEYFLPMEFPLIATLYLNYKHGFMSVDNIVLSNDIPETSGSSLSYNGGAWSVEVGVKIPFRFGDRTACGKIPEKKE